MPLIASKWPTSPAYRISRRLLGLAILVVCLAPASLQAQTPIIIGPQTQLQWDVPGLTLAQAQACTFSVAANGAPATPVVGPVTCTAPVAPATAPSCGVNLIAQTAIPVGSNSLTLTATCGGVTSVPSVPLAYVDVVVPIPSNLRIK